MLACAFRFRLLPSLLENIDHGCWTQHASYPIRNRNVVDLVFTIGLTRLQTSDEAGLPGRDRLPLSRSLKSPLLNRLPHITQSHIPKLAGIVYLF